MQKKTVYLLSSVAALSMVGNVAQLAHFGEARAGVEVNHPMEYEKVHTTEQISGLTVAQVAGVACTKLNADYELSGATVCVFTDLTGIYLQPNYEGDPDAVHVRVLGGKTFSLVAAPLPD
jgi:hypothetical protein